MVGHYCGENNRPEWNALCYARDVPDNVPIIAGSGFWDSDDRDAFVQAGVQFFYDRPCKNACLEGMIKAALKVGQALKMLTKDKNDFVVTHLHGDKDTLSVYKITRK